MAIQIQRNCAGGPEQQISLHQGSWDYSSDTDWQMLNKQVQAQIKVTIYGFCEFSHLTCYVQTDLKPRQICAAFPEGDKRNIPDRKTFSFSFK